MTKKVLIIGAGLSGLLLGYRLKQKGIAVQIVEARDRIGGRIHTLHSVYNTPIEMGATWLGAQHQSLIKLLQELELDVFPQFMDGKALFEPLSTAPAQEVDLPANNAPSYRIKGGSIALINTLAGVFDEQEIRLNTTVDKIIFKKDAAILHSNNGIYTADLIVSTLPPNLFVNKVSCIPALPEELNSIAKRTHTWMGESIKFGVSYDHPFWKEKGFSGTIFSNVGPVSEVYDHSNFDEDRFALKGFLNGGLANDSKEHREAKVMQQLTKLFGKDAASYLQYEECVWAQQQQTFVPYDSYVLPHQNNGQAAFQKLYADDKLILAGAETASRFGGYMEGAVISAENTAQKIGVLI